MKYVGFQQPIQASVAKHWKFVVILHFLKGNAVNILF